LVSDSSILAFPHHRFFTRYKIHLRAQAMAELTEEARSVYSLLHGEIEDLLDRKLSGFADTLTKSINTKFDAATATFNSQIDDLRDEFSFPKPDLDPGTQAADLPPTTVPPSSTPATSSPSTGFPSSSAPVRVVTDPRPDGPCSEKLVRGTGYTAYIPPPARGTRLDPVPCPPARYAERPPSDTADVFGTGPRVELPRFDGTNPRLWQDRCEDYFQFWDTPKHMWTQYASARFDGAAARWLEAARRRIPRATWAEFCQHLHTRFGRNQHCSLARRMIQIAQTSSVTEYVERFCELYDQLTAYEVSPDSVHYTTKFIEGLKPVIRMAVAIQQPQDLDKAIELALLFEELTEEPELVSAPSFPAYQSTMTRRAPVLPFQPPPKPVVPRLPEDRNAREPLKTISPDDKWHQLRNYRKSKGLCFTCGERWAKDHQCKSSVQLHVVQEMMDFLSVEDQQYYECTDTDVDPTVQLMCVSAAALGKMEAEQTMHISVMIQGVSMNLLIDSGSTHSFLDIAFQPQLQGCSPIRPLAVKIANGAVIILSFKLSADPTFSAYSRIS
jgi:hypothetical protein